MKVDNITNQEEFVDDARRKWTVVTYERNPIRSLDAVAKEVRDRYQFGDVEELPVSERKFYKFEDENDIFRILCDCVADEEQGFVYYVSARHRIKGWSNTWTGISSSDVANQVAQVFIESLAEEYNKGSNPRDRWENAVSKASDTL